MTKRKLPDGFGSLDDGSNLLGEGAQDLQLGRMRDKQRDAIELAIMRGELPFQCSKKDLLAAVRSLGLDVQKGDGFFTVRTIVDNYNFPVRIFFGERDGQPVLAIWHKPALEQFFAEVVKRRPELFSVSSQLSQRLDETSAVTQEIAALPQYEPPIGNIENMDVQFIGQREAMISKGFVETAVGPCVVMVVTNKDTGEQFFAHVDVDTLLGQFPELRDWVNTEAVIAGGQIGQSEGTIEEILKALKKLGVKECSKFLLLNSGDTTLRLSSVPVRTKEGYRTLLSTTVRSNLREQVVIPPMMGMKTPLRMRRK
jgi:hypothetical protein